MLQEKKNLGYFTLLDLGQTKVWLPQQSSQVLLRTHVYTTLILGFVPP